MCLTPKLNSLGDVGVFELDCRAVGDFGDLAPAVGAFGDLAPAVGDFGDLVPACPAAGDLDAFAPPLSPVLAVVAFADLATASARFAASVLSAPPFCAWLDATFWAALKPCVAIEALRPGEALRPDLPSFAPAGLVPALRQRLVTWRRSPVKTTGLPKVFLTCVVKLRCSRVTGLHQSFLRSLACRARHEHWFGHVVPD